MTGSPRIFTNLTDDQLVKLTAWTIRNDRSLSYAVSKAITDHLSDVTPYEGKAAHKVMARTSEANVEALRAYHGQAWRYINACVQRMLEDEQR